MLKNWMLAALGLYRKGISPLTPPRCRYIPTCSQYAVEAVTKYGAVRGGLLAALRLSRCHPLSLYYRRNGPYDPVP